MSAVESKVKQIVAKKLGVSEDKVLPTSTFTGDLGADSLDLVELIMELEETFEVDTIPDDVSGKWTTVKDVIDFLNTKV